MIDAENPSVHLGKITLVNDKVQIAAIKEVLIAKGMCLVFVDGYAPVMDSQGWSEYKVPQNAESITLTTGPKPGEGPLVPGQPAECASASTIGG